MPELEPSWEGLDTHTLQETLGLIFLLKDTSKHIHLVACDEEKKGV